MEKLKKPSWVKISEDELKKVIASLAEKYSPSQIGIVLRDQYGIPTTKVFGKKLKQYLEELGINKKEELENAQKKLETMQEHFKENKGDKIAKHKIQKAQSHFNALKKYHNKG